VEKETGVKGKKVLILVEDLYQDLELWYPKLRLTEEGAEVTVAGPRKGEYKGNYILDTTGGLWYNGCIR